VVHIRVGDDVYELSESSAATLLQRIEPTEPSDEESASVSLEHHLRDPADDALVDLDDGELAVLGVVIEAWTAEAGVDALPDDVHELRQAIAERFD
jgi:hypothetical protein